MGMVKRLTYRDHEGRARFTNHGMHIYCSSQATADVLCKYEERLERQLSLKEQEAVPVDTKMIGMPNGTDIEVFCCPDCRMVLDESFHFCPNCGQAVKWDA